jgi:8-oxo-dGTP pyrophosphatase MutT (NUDIX family)
VADRDGSRYGSGVSHAQGRDRRRTVPREGQVVQFVYLPPTFAAPFERVTSVSVVPFTKDGSIVAALLDRGPDLPGGHVQEHEQTPEETVRREGLEEAGITLGDLVIAQVIQSDYYGSEPDDLTYIVVMAGFVTEIRPFEPCADSDGRSILDVEDFLAQYRAGDSHLIRQTVRAAQRAVARGPASPQS